MNFFIGNDKKNWKTGIPVYGAVKYKDVYENIDIRYYGNNELLEYDIIVRPGADPSRVRFSYEGISALKILDDGSLRVEVDADSFIHKKPYIYQVIDGEKVEVAGNYKLFDNNTFGFQLASYNKEHTVVIDPVVLYSTYLGGSHIDTGEDIAVDSSGNIYVSGETMSSNFPVQSELQQYIPFGYDVFVTKFNPSGNALIYSTFIGGSDNYDVGKGIVVDGDGNAYIGGTTYSSNFPTTQGAIQQVSGGGRDAFVVKLGPSGELLYSTFVGGQYDDYGYGIDIDETGSAYVTGTTSSLNFPTTPGCYKPSQNRDSSDAYVTKISPAGDAFVYSTYLGGSRYETGYGIVVDNAGFAFVVGSTTSSNFPVMNALQAAFGGGQIDAFVVKLALAGDSLVYSSYLGGSLDDQGYGIAVDDTGSVYLTGYTSSSDFPVNNPIQQHLGGQVYDAFVTKINPDGNALVYSTYIAGTYSDIGNDIEVDDFGYVYVAGQTTSSDFPLVGNPISSYMGGRWQPFVTIINESGNAFVYSSFLGQGYANGLIVDDSKNIYIAGSGEGFPVVNAFQPNTAGYGDAFVMKIGTNVNRPPLANAGTDQSVHPGNLVTLNGTVSSDPDENYPLAYLWQIISKPEGSAAELSGGTFVNPTFTPDLLGDYLVKLTVTDTLGLSSAADEVLISTYNVPPVADAGVDQAIIQIGSIVQLNGCQSYDEEGDEINYLWSFIEKPAESNATFTNPTACNPVFVADIHGNFVLGIVVTDIFGASNEDSVLVSFDNLKPVANAGNNQSVGQGETVHLNGSLSFDANLDPITYSWSIVTKPDGSTSAINQPTDIQTDFVADIPGTYVVSLVVNDGFEDSDKSNITVMAISYQDAITQTLQDAIVRINNLDNNVFKNENLKNALTNKINAALDLIDQGLYQDALDKLRNDVLGKTDGCAASSPGAPDKNDWLVTCDAQNQIYPIVMNAIYLLENLT